MKNNISRMSIIKIIITIRFYNLTIKMNNNNNNNHKKVKIITSSSNYIPNFKY